MAWIRCTGNTGGSLKVRTASGQIATFETNMANVLQEVKCEIVATGGNGSPDNPISINGYSSANITRCGVNLFNKTEVMDGYIIDSTGEYRASDTRKCTDFLPIKGGETYKILSEQIDSSWGAWYDSDKNYISACAGYYVGGSTVKTAPANACYVRLTVWSTTSGDIDTFGLNYPATDTTYHAYNGQTYTVNFGQTVYGGVLDVTRGKLHVTWAGVDLGSQNWNIYGGDKFYTTISDLKLPTTTAERATGMLCSIFAPSSGLSVGEMDNNSFLRFNQSENFWVRDTSYSDAPSFKTAMNGVMLAYELATPFDIGITPEVISAIVGVNNVYSDTNGDTTVQYKDSIQHYIDKHIGG